MGAGRTSSDVAMVAMEVVEAVEAELIGGASPSEEDTWTGLGAEAGATLDGPLLSGEYATGKISSFQSEA